MKENTVRYFLVGLFCLVFFGIFILLSKDKTSIFLDSHLCSTPVKWEGKREMDLNLCIRVPLSDYVLFVPEKANVEKQNISGTFHGFDFRIVTNIDATSFEDIPALFYRSVPTKKAKQTILLTDTGYLYTLPATFEARKCTMAVSLTSSEYFFFTYSLDLGNQTKLSISVVTKDKEKINEAMEALVSLSRGVKKYEDCEDAIKEAIKKQVYL